MPEGLFNVIAEATIRNVVGLPLAQVASELEAIKEPNKSLIYWLLDLMVSLIVTMSVIIIDSYEIITRLK